MWRNIASNALTLFVVILAVLGGVIAWAKNQYAAPGPLAQAICLSVESGWNMQDVSDVLEGEDAVTSPYIFHTGANYTDKSQLLKAGSFLVPEAASMVQIVDIITRGGASTCGTEVVYRIGVNRTEMQVRELDPANNLFVEV
ncbi:MAG: endolytic transglycosylase MltG, partial [Paracoccaceae bacterium]